MTEILPATSPEALKLACRLLCQGKAIAFPTDTIYGLGAIAFEPLAVRHTFVLKRRPANKALPVFIAQSDDLNLVAQNVPAIAWPLLAAFWPGALTVVLAKVAALPYEVTAGQNTVAVRLPNHPTSLELVRQAGHPLAVTSANLSGQTTPNTAQGVAAQLGEQLPLVLDGGPSQSTQASTIIDLSLTPPHLLRQGCLTLTQLQPFLPDLVQQL